MRPASALRTIIATSFALFLTSCGSDDHDIQVLTTTQENVFPTSSNPEFDQTSVELITGTVWQNGPYLLFYLRAGENHRSYLVDPEGLVRLPEWSTLASGSEEKRDHLHTYDRFAPNLPQSLIATPGGALRQMQAGDLYILDFVSLVDSGKGLKIYDEPSSEILSYYIDDLPADQIIGSTIGKVFLFDILPETIVAALLEKPETVFSVPETPSVEEGDWEMTDLMVPFDLNDTASIDRLTEAAQIAEAQTQAQDGA